MSISTKMIKQKLVILHPGKIGNSRRQEKLNKTGFPTLTSVSNSKTFGTSYTLKVPSDVHVLWEIYRTDKEPETNQVNRLSVTVVGNTTPADLSEYSNSVKTVDFSGYIGCTKTALQMVHQLKRCDEVRFHLGNAEQLPYLLSKEKHSILPAKSVKKLSINMMLEKTDPDFMDVVNRQLKTLLVDCIKAFPFVESFKTKLPPEGCYFDLLKEILPEFKRLNCPQYEFIPEIKDNKISVVRQRIQIAKIVKAQSEALVQVSQSHNLQISTISSKSVTELQVQKRQPNYQHDEEKDYKKQRHSGNLKSRRGQHHYSDKSSQNHTKRYEKLYRRRVSLPNQTVNPNLTEEKDQAEMSTPRVKFENVEHISGGGSRRDGHWEGWYNDHNPNEEQSFPNNVPYRRLPPEMNRYKDSSSDPRTSSDHLWSQQTYPQKQINPNKPTLEPSSVFSGIDSSNVKKEKEDVWDNSEKQESDWEEEADTNWDE